jgi:1,2-diacylglycerol-3-alpha-glucose alpha-1,2-galactosyltransferase
MGKRKKINMLSKAHTVKGQGVLSAHDEQVALAKELEEFTIVENVREKSDIIHCHTINPEFLLWCFLHPGSIRVGYVHFVPRTIEGSIRLPGFAKKIFYWYILYFYRKMDRLVTVNPYFIDVLEDYGIPKEKVSYIPNFISDKQFHPLDEAERQEARKEYGIPQDRFTVLCVGQLQIRKGFFDYIELAKEHPDMEFLWAGGFPFGKMMDGYEDIQKAMETLPDNMKMLGLIDREKMNRVYNMADVFLLPSYEELFPMTILEAMSCQVPVIVRNLPIYNNILFDYCLRGEDKDEFGYQLEELKEKPGYYKIWKEQAAKGHGYYSRDRMKVEWEYFYQRICTEMEIEKEGAAGKEKIFLWKKEQKSFGRH